MTLAAPQDNSNRMPSTKNIVKKIIVDGHFDVTAFIYPGSDRSLVRSSAARTLSVMESCIPLTLRGFGGGETFSSKRVNLPITIDKRDCTAEMYVVSDDYADRKFDL